MDDGVEITISIERGDLNKLAVLAGNDTQFSEYITKAIRRLYAERYSVGEDFDLEGLVSVSEELVDQNREYRGRVRVLQDQLKKLTMSHEELMATVDHFQNLSSQLHNLGSSDIYH